MNMQFKLTKQEALSIQAQQVEYYSKYCRDLAAMVAALTTADQLDDDIKYDVTIINRHIPRGGKIEQIAGLIDMGGS